MKIAENYLGALMNYITLATVVTSSSVSRRRRASEAIILAEKENDFVYEYITLAVTKDDLDSNSNVPLIIEQIRYLNFQLLNVTQIGMYIYVLLNQLISIRNILALTISTQKQWLI